MGADKNAEKVFLANPDPDKAGVRIAKDIYEPVRAAMLEAIGEAGELAFSALSAEVERRTPLELWESHSVGWYTTSVKLDLEAKGLITKHGSPQILRLA